MSDQDDSAELILTATMLEKYAPELFPGINDEGQVHFGRAIMESAAEAIREAITARPLEEWHEDMGDKLWWRFPIEETPFVGSPNTCGRTVEIITRYLGTNDEGEPGQVIEKFSRYDVGGSRPTRMI